jgi:uncharacterized protein YhbP (UPF0306 family)
MSLENSMDNDSKKIYEFIKQHQLMVISTVTHDALPQAAVVGFAEKENLELIFGTFKTSRKYMNLQKNPRVAIVIGWEGGKTVQYEGEVVELEGQERSDAMNVFLSKTSSAAKFLSNLEEAIFKVVPKWIRYSNVSEDPWDIIEIRF